MTFQSLAHRVEIAATKGHSVSSFLKAELPCLVKDIRSDLNNETVLDLWGMSNNWDELAQAPIVAPQIVSAICEELVGKHSPGLRDIMTEDAVHAGIMHAYCYLFSRLETEFGFKGDRWLKGEIARVLSLPESVLMPRPKSGTLLTNATYLFGRIAFRGDVRRTTALRQIRDRVPREIREFPYRRLRWTRLVETVRVGRSGKIIFRSDLIPPLDESAGASWLLIYSLNSNSGADRNGLPVLSTAFPLEAINAHSMLDPKQFGRDREVRPRYNVWVAEFPRGAKPPKSMVHGRREAWSFSAAGRTRLH
ncbi:MAG: hypothetical protein MPJ50_15775 [Pirellulales bacterium]|nr:hypothetical protein [Pirellulales bacterium]